MEKTQLLPCEALTKGYVLFPKQLLEQLLSDQTEPMSELDAWFALLTKVNYKEVSCRIRGTSVVCKRGESLYSLLFWSECFRWTRSKTRCYFGKLQRLGFIRLMPRPYTTHLMVVDYDLWTGCKKEAHLRMAEKSDEGFKEFWNTYHDITGVDKVNIARARREWQKLALEERRLATSQVDEYYEHLRSLKYCMQAAAYLSNKAFLNEYFI